MPDLYITKKFSDAQLRHRREILLLLLKDAKYDYEKFSILRQSLVGTVFQTDFLWAKSLNYVAYHPGGWCIITKLPSFSVCKTLLGQMVHVASTLLAKVEHLVKRFESI